MSKRLTNNHGRGWVILRVHWVFIVMMFLSIGGMIALSWQIHHRQIMQIGSDIIQMTSLDKASFPDDTQYQHALVGQIDQVILKMGDRIQDYRPFMLKADALAALGEYADSGENYRRALQVMDSPELIDTVRIAMENKGYIVEEFLPKEVELGRLKKVVKMKLEYVRQNKYWHDEKEIHVAIGNATGKS